MMDNEVKNNISENLPEESLPEEIIEQQDFRGMNRFMLMIIAAAMIPWLFGGYEIFGFLVTGWAWVIPLIISALVCLNNIQYIKFPLGLWLVWISLLLIYWFLGRDNPNAFQSLLQMISPFVVGCAASTFRPDIFQLGNIIRWITRLAWVACIIIIIRIPMILTGSLPGYSFMAAEMIGLLLLAAFYISFYACGSHHHIYYYFSMLAITFLSLVRGPIVAMLSCVPFTLAPLGKNKRILFFILVIILTLVIFNTERVQQKMFYSGTGELTDVRLSNPDIRSHGRFAMWDALWPRVQDKPWFGNGWNSHRSFLMSFGFKLYLPHNDWLKLLHDIGFIGAGCFLLTMLLQTFLLAKIARFSTGAHQMLAYGVATAFIPYTLIMLTDNVILYVQFFGNLHFALIGIIYGAVINDET